jgi:osmotically-inducible protein OsmY
MGTAPSEFAEIIKFRFGAPVVASDGPAGYVAHVIVDSVAGVVTHVGVKLGRLESYAHNIPVALLSAAGAEQVELTITLDDIKQKAQPMADGNVQLGHSTVVDVNGKRQGKLVQVSAVRDTLAMHRLVVERGLGRGEALIPVDGNTRWDVKRVSVQLADAQARGLISYRPDAELLREVTQALYDYPRLRIDLRGMRVRTADGDVWLIGHVSSDLNSRVAEDQLVGIAGLADVHNELMTDTDLASEVAAALAQDARTRGQHIGVYPVLGEVRLRGTVKTQGAKDAATQVASAVPGAERVVNDLHVDPNAEVVPVLAGITGEEDMVPGGA